MTQTKKLLINTTNPSIEARDLKLIEAKTGNLYESIAITAKRANQINTKINYKTLKKALNKCKIKRTKPLLFKRYDIRKFLQPFYSNDNKISNKDQKINFKDDGFSQ
mgnify:CR=1 FL=1